MSDNTDTEVSNYSNKWIKWIEEAIEKEHLKYYEYENFTNIEVIGSGGFGEVYRANWKNSYQYFALKRFLKLDDTTVKEIVHELKLHRSVDYHENIIRFYGITKSNYGNDHLKSYLLVVEYADGGTLRNYLKKNFNGLTWKNKYSLAHQLACAVLCLHDEGIVHRDLHSSNVLVHQGIIKLADFGLSKRIGEASNSQSKLVGIFPYIDPKRFDRKNNPTQEYTLNEKEKSDVYSIGVLLWEISSGKPPFCNEVYDFGLITQLSQGLRETPIPNSPKDYVNIYTECWNKEPADRPTVEVVVNKLRAIIAKTDIITENNQMDNNNKLSIYLQNKQYSNMKNVDTSTSANNSLHGAMSKLIQNFDKMTTEELDLISENILSQKDYIIMADELIDFVFADINEGHEWKVDVFHNKHNINLKVFYNWLLNNQTNLNFTFLLGYFNFYGIETNKNYEKAFNLFIKVSKQNHILAQYYVGVCYQYGYGVAKNEQLSFEHYKYVADKDYPAGKFKIGVFYKNGIGIEKNIKLAFYCHEEAANLGNSKAQNNLALMYENGIGVDIDYNKAIELYTEAANSGNSNAQYKLALIYENGIDYNIAVELYTKAANSGNNKAQYKLAIMYENGRGVDKDNKKAIELYQKAANLGNNKARYNLALMYENGIGVDVNYNKAIELYTEAANSGNNEAQCNLASIYKNGKGVDINYDKAFELYTKAANSGNDKAQYKLALMYEYGRGVNKDLEQAMFWYKESANHGYKYAQGKLKMHKITNRKRMGTCKIN